MHMSTLIKIGLGYQGNFEAPKNNDPLSSSNEDHSKNINQIFIASNNSSPEVMNQANHVQFNVSQDNSMKEQSTRN